MFCNLDNKARTCRFMCGLHKFLLPMSFVLGSVVNIFMFYLGFAYIENPIRKYTFMFACILFAFFCLLTMCWMLINHEIKKTVLLKIFLLLGFYAFAYLVGVSKHGFHAVIIDHACQFAVFSISALSAGIYTGIKQTEDEFFPMLEKISILVFPAAIIYFNGALFNVAGSDTRDLGVMNYMSVAYAFMPFLLAHIYQFSNGGKQFFPSKIKHPQIIRVMLILVYWICIIATGTRGCYICVLGFCIFLILFKFLRHERIARSVIISFTLITIISFNLFVWAPTGVSAVKRMDIFIHGLQEGEVVTSNSNVPMAEEAELHKEIIDKLNMISAMTGNGEKQNCNYSLVDRGTLFKLAIAEVIENPQFGIGLGGFEIKYGRYPHNAILELFCETGIILGTFFLGILLWCLTKIIRYSFIRENVYGLFLIFLTYAIRAQMSGSVWECSAMACAFGYAFAIQIPCKKSCLRAD